MISKIARGRPQFATDPSGSVVWDMGEGVTPFGDSVNLAGAFAQRLMFPGQYADVETGGEGDDVTLSHNWHRTYDPTSGRYLQSDPIGLAGGLNRYAYVGGNPVSYIDPVGLKFVPKGGVGNGYFTEDGGTVEFWVADRRGENGKKDTIECGCETNIDPNIYDVDFVYSGGKWYKIKDGEARVKKNGVYPGKPNNAFLYAAERVYEPANQGVAWTILDKARKRYGPIEYLQNISNSSYKNCNQIKNFPINMSPRHSRTGHSFR